MDVKACSAVREAVGPDLPLMLDANHWYSREDAWYIGRELEKLDYYWYEEPMDEHSMSSYIWLAKQLSMPVLGPEMAQGQVSHPRGMDRAGRVRHYPDRRDGRRWDRPEHEDRPFGRVARCGL